MLERVRWERLFADLEAQLDTADAAELAAEVSDRARRETARTRLLDRGRLALGSTLTVGIGAAGVLDGALRAVGADWLLLVVNGADCLVPAHAVEWVVGLPRLALEPDSIGAVEARLTLAHSLRGIARNRAAVTVVVRSGATVTATIDRVGADYVDVAEHPPHEPRRATDVTRARTIAFAAIAAVRSA